jgi:hypothetical protein
MIRDMPAKVPLSAALPSARQGAPNRILLTQLDGESDQISATRDWVLSSFTKLEVADRAGAIIRARNAGLGR